MRLGDGGWVKRKRKMVGARVGGETMVEEEGSVGRG